MCVAAVIGGLALNVSERSQVPDRDGLMHGPTGHVPRALNQQAALANLKCVYFLFILFY